MVLNYRDYCEVKTREIHRNTAKYDTIAMDSFKEYPELVRSHVPGSLAQIDCSLNPSEAKSGPCTCSNSSQHTASAGFKPHFTLPCSRNSCYFFLPVFAQVKHDQVRV